MNTIAIDCGASYIKGALIADGTILLQKQAASPAVPNSGEILSPVWIQALLPIVKEMLMQLADGQDEVKLCISNEMHGFMLAYDDGTPFTDYISWQKEYGSISVHGVCAMTILGEERYTEDIRSSGMPLRSGLPNCNLLYLNLAGFLGKTEKQLYFYTLGDYIVRMLTGTLSITCHPTNAAATGLYDLRSGTWNAKLIVACGGENIIFPEVGKTATDFNLNGTRVMVLPAIGDQQAALLGAGLERDGDLSFNLGTGAQVSKLISEYSDDSAGHIRNYQVRPFFDDKYIKTIPHLPSGRALNVYFRFIKDILSKFCNGIEDREIWSAIIRAEQECQHTDIKCQMTFFENPITKETTGNIENISEYSLTLGSLYYAIFQSLADNFIWAAKEIEPDLSKVERIIFSGGIAARLESVRDRIMGSYDRNIKVVVAENETLTGLYRYGNKMIG
ncbi:MAG: hypothetical protein K2K96_08345 [Lachnospiraceae bacterium]|nr:hypothetical protein [Lachnospiraceae bacterium]